MSRTAQLLQIAQLGHPVLRERCQELVYEQIAEDRGQFLHIQHLIDDMIATCLDVDGAGLAAPQVYQPIRLFIVASHPTLRYPNAPLMEPTAMINPIILEASAETEKEWEGCLSIPGIRGNVQRAKSVQVVYFNRRGERETKTFEGFVARIIQHEIDHLEGTVFLDRVERREIITEKEFSRLLREKK